MSSDKKLKEMLEKQEKRPKSEGNLSFIHTIKKSTLKLYVSSTIYGAHSA